MLELERVTHQEYAAAVIELFTLASQRGTSGSRVAAQVLLSAYNGEDFQLDIIDLCLLDRYWFGQALTVIRGRYDTQEEPHLMIVNGGQLYQELWKSWQHLHISQRGVAAPGHSPQVA